MPRVSDSDLKSYSEAKTFPHTPGEDLKLMALELIKARDVVEHFRIHEKACPTCDPFYLEAYDGTVSTPASSDS